ncbi:hypothetical protein F5Y15DRAFT_389767 [Xylariaceae sp. FL0016]|nr:hypothetical protein F5Y15DRAFT_389767 [Xylariaceae sp. FL0016]
MRPGRSSSRSSVFQETPVYLDYPELELLPSPAGFQDLQALERNIGALKRTYSGQRLQHRPSMSIRLAKQVQKIQHGDVSSSSSEVSVPGSLGNSRLLLTPSPHNRSNTRAVSGNTDFATPQSHMSYEDCVPTHMLDDEDDNNDSLHNSASVKVEHATALEIKRPNGAKFVDARGQIDTDGIYEAWKRMKEPQCEDRDRLKVPSMVPSTDATEYRDMLDEARQESIRVKGEHDEQNHR